MIHPFSESRVTSGWGRSVSTDVFSKIESDNNWVFFSCVWGPVHSGISRLLFRAQNRVEMQQNGDFLFPGL